jgi:predicted small secreted protein
MNKKTQSRALSAFALIAAIGLLSACSTVEGLKSDLSRGYDAVTDTFAKAIDPVKEQKKKLPLYDGSCPGVTVRPDLRSLTEYSDDSKPSDASLVSEITILGVENTCRVENGTLVLQIDIALQGKTGSKARARPTDKPSFAYPYFVAVTDNQGAVLAKEIFAASVAYGATQTEINQTESIFQTMPFPDTGRGQTYDVIVGFQLTPDQLAYNQKKSAAAAPLKAIPAAAGQGASNPPRQ